MDSFFSRMERSICGEPHSWEAEERSREERWMTSDAHKRMSVAKKVKDVAKRAYTGAMMEQK